MFAIREGEKDIQTILDSVYPDVPDEDKPAKRPAVYGAVNTLIRYRIVNKLSSCSTQRKLDFASVILFVMV